MKEFLRNRSRLLIWLVSGFFLFLAIVSLGFYGYAKYFVEDPRVVAKVGAVEITRNDLKEQIYETYLEGTPEDPKKVDLTEKKSLTAYLVEVEIDRQYNESHGVTVSDEDVMNSISSTDLAGSWDNYSVEQQTAIKNAHRKSLTIEKAQADMLGYKEGEFILFRFDKYLEYADVDKLDDTGDAELIEKQRVYAESLAQDVYKKLSTGEITFAEAKTLVGTDKTIGLPGFEPYHPGISAYFDKDQYGNGLGYFDETSYKGMMDGLSSVTKAGELTQPFVLQANVGSEYKDMAYVVASVDKVKEGDVLSYNNWLSLQKSTLPVKMYLGRYFWEGHDLALGSVLKVQVANACTVSYIGSHRTNITLYMNKKTATGTLVNYDPGNVQFTAGDNDMLVYTTSCTGGTHQYSVTKNDTGNATIGLNDSVDGIPALIDCDRTSVATINLPDASTLGGGSWDVDLSTATLAQWYKSFYSQSGVMTLDLSEPSNWANGDNIQKKVIFTPVYSVPTTTTTYKVRPYISFWVDGNEVTEANPGDLVEVALYGINADTKTIPEMYIRNNIDNNGVNNTAGSGTLGDPYSIRALVGGTSKTSLSTVCASSSCNAEYQGAGDYGTPTYDKLQYRAGSVSSAGVIVGDYYEPIFSFKVPTSDSYRGKLISSRMGVLACSVKADLNSCAPQVLSNLATLKIRDEVSLRVKSSPTAGGTVSGAPHYVNGAWSADTIVNSTDATENFTIGETTRFSATPATGYSFSNWSAITGYSCPVAGSTSVGPVSVTMAANVGCQGNFVAAPVNTATVYPVIELVSPAPNNGSATTATLTGPSTNLTSRFRVPNYDSASGPGTVVINTIYYKVNSDGSAIIGTPINVSTSSPTSINSSGIVEYTVSTGTLDNDQLYSWQASAQIVSGNLRDTSGNQVSTNLVASNIWSFIYVSNPATTCVISPTTGSRPLSVTVNLASTGITPQPPFTINLGDGQVKTADTLPYYYVYSTAGSYTISVGNGSVSNICSADVTVTGASDGDGGEVTP